MGRTFLVADLHFGHRKVSEIRGFESTDEHDAALVENWNRVVRPDDTVWVLGDITISGPSFRDHGAEVVGSLNGAKHLITGNHDACFPGHRDSYKWQGAYRQYFESVQPFARMKNNGRYFLLSHFPYLGAGDRTAEERYAQYRLPNLGLPLVHGHTHSSEKSSYAILYVGPYAVDLARQVHVGLDAWDLTPVPLEDVVGLLWPS